MSGLITHSRRRFLLGAGALLAAPAIVRVASIMPVSVAADISRPSDWLMRYVANIQADASLSLNVRQTWITMALTAPQWKPIARTSDGRYISA